MHRNGHRIVDIYRSFVIYARLVRLPNLFTAPPDVILGAAIVASSTNVAGRTVGGLAMASMFLYAAGTSLNDYVDAPEDARLRPERPIPIGVISRRQALALGTVLLGSGIALAATVGGIQSGAVAALLALAIVLYNGMFKGSALGFLFMGCCRGLNVLLGMTAAGALVTDSLPLWGVTVLLLVTGYIASITFMAESETGESASLAVPVAIAGTALAVVGGISLVAIRSPSLDQMMIVGILIAGFAIWTGGALRTAYADPTAKVIGPAVGTCILALVVFDAAVAGIAGVGWALIALAFLAPAIGLSKAFDVT